MIVSHRHRFIFLHGLKTAGSSLTIALARHLDDDDLLSIDGFTLADFMAQDVVPRGFFCPRNIRVLHAEGFTESARVMERVLAQGSFQALPKRPDPDQLFADLRSSSLYKSRTRQHATARQIQRSFPAVWDGYFTFAIERNPWERMLSLYHWRWRDRPQRSALKRLWHGGPARPSFEKFLASLQRGPKVQRRYRSHHHSNFSIYAIKGRPALDFVGQYEQLQTDLAKIEARLGFAFRADLPAAKREHRKAQDDIRYTAEMDRIIEQVFRREIGLFGYSKPAHLG